MLSTPERLAFVLLALTSLLLAAHGVSRIVRAIGRGYGRPRWSLFVRRVVPVSIDILLQRPIFRTRPLVSLLHAGVFFAFVFYGLVNVLDLLEGFTGFTTLHRGGLFAAYNLVADLLSVAALAGMLGLLFRRFGLRPFRFNERVLLLPSVRFGIARDSAIVGGFILLHVGSRWIGQAVRIAESGQPDWSQPTASVVATLFDRWSPESLTVASHVTWWLALGLILAFLPYFPYSKHIHLFMAPINLILREERPLGQLEPPVARDGQLGGERLEQLRWFQLLDAYACIMCNRCQDVCPAHGTGRSLSPAALEINKRYYLNRNLATFAGGTSSPPLLEIVTSKDAVWSCTTCAACVRICPVGNRPMLDLIDIRRALISQGDPLDPNLQAALESLARYGNSFGRPARQRARWAKELSFPIKDARKEPVEYLWFVGDFASFDPRMQENTKTVAQLFHVAGLDFGLLYEDERNAGNDVRRVGEEGLFELLAEQNLRAFEKAQFRAIVTTDPHSYNALKNEYAAFGFSVPVYHYTELLAELLESGRLPLRRAVDAAVTYHDPCYLGRYNRITAAPRRILRALGADLREMPRHGENTYCCGAGGGQIWMDSGGQERPSEQRIREAVSLGEDVRYFVVACPKDMAMYSDAVKTTGYEGRLVVTDIARLVAAAVGLEGATTPTVAQEVS
ncbi:(Fe-S)-binding protein [Thermomicrobium sp. 4228-Ro]|uniref:(Fe-S)-binding protein n=1 Tax=Thermomicrobium sp. 4228-Ro TaxID=2993937 RepID=UPI002248B239|nr:(Fe-S)-binding protein [Thermomicrobium sp. 4228-Ro]MCX2726781.1 (Fe-S)-binding protein [Thermomicrobium sp. 4228-Ro]